MVLVRSTPLLALLACSGDPSVERYTVGGEVQGLGEDTITLGLGEQRIQIDRDGPFTFAESLPDGAEWSVAITEPPSRHACALSGASGVIDGADATGVRVACELDVFPLIVRVQGLDGEVTLRYDGEEITIAADGDHTLAQALRRGSRYDVAIAGEPDEQICRGARLFGTIDQAPAIVDISCEQAFRVTGTVSGLDGRTIGLRVGEVEQTLTEGPFRHDLKLADRATWIAAIFDLPSHARCSIAPDRGNVRGADPVVDVRCDPWLNFENYQAASTVIGQPDLWSGDFYGGRDPGAYGFREPWASPVFADGSWYLTDSLSHRIVVYDGVPTGPDDEAAFVIGQPDLVSNGPQPPELGIEVPYDVTTDGQSIAVADPHRARVVLWSEIPSELGVAPDGALGQPDLSTTSPRCDETGLSFPETVRYIDGLFIVSDGWNNRVMLWHGFPEPGVAPDVVLGQPDRESCVDNGPTGQVGPSTMYYPTDVAWNGEQFFVNDSGNLRVLVWNGLPTRDGQPADLVLGQPDLTTPGSFGQEPSDRIFRYAYMIHATRHQLFLTDSDARRVLIWNELPVTNDQPADVVLGQPDFTSRLGSDEDMDRRMDYPAGLFIHAGRLYVTDWPWNRVVVFDSLESND